MPLAQQTLPSPQPSRRPNPLPRSSTRNACDLSHVSVQTPDPVQPRLIPTPLSLPKSLLLHMPKFRGKLAQCSTTPYRSNIEHERGHRLLHGKEKKGRIENHHANKDAPARPSGSTDFRQGCAPPAVLPLPLLPPAKGLGAHAP